MKGSKILNYGPLPNFFWFADYYRLGKNIVYRLLLRVKDHEKAVQSDPQASRDCPNRCVNRQTNFMFSNIMEAVIACQL